MTSTATEKAFESYPAHMLKHAIEKVKEVIPVTLLIIFLLPYLHFRRITETAIVMLSVLFALVGGVWLMLWLGHNLSVVVVGFIALAGVAAETGVIMLFRSPGRGLQCARMGIL